MNVLSRRAGARTGAGDSTRLNTPMVWLFEIHKSVRLPCFKFVGTESVEKSVRSGVIPAMFLVAGTCIGGGMLALPVATGISGFFPSLVMMAITWIAMTASALLLLEVCLWMEEGAHMITMTSRILGPIGKGVAWVLYLYICYASLVAYTAGGGAQLADGMRYYMEMPISKEIGALLFILIFTAVIYLGHKIVGRVNTILFIAMVASYFALITVGLDDVKPSYLLYKRWSGSLLAIPLLLTIFSFQTLVPSLVPYLKRNMRALRIAVIGGTALVFVIYAIWQLLILGIVPVVGENGLTAALVKGEPATLFLKEHVTGRWVVLIAEYFAFFAIVTSFLGIALGLFDFLADGLHLQKTGWRKLLIGVLIVIPVFIFAVKFERVFMIALDTTGGFGDSILNGMIPVLMVWVGRYHLGYQGEVGVRGGKSVLVLIFAFYLFCLTIEVLSLTGVFSSIYETPYDIIEVHNV